VLDFFLIVHFVWIETQTQIWIQNLEHENQKNKKKWTKPTFSRHAPCTCTCTLGAWALLVPSHAHAHGAHILEPCLCMISRPPRNKPWESQPKVVHAADRNCGNLNEKSRMPRSAVSRSPGRVRGFIYINPGRRASSRREVRDKARERLRRK
jgi:hypothetical protein